MQLREVVTSLTFRFIAKYLFVLSAAVFLLLAVIYGIYSYDYFRKFSASIIEEQESLQLIYRGQSLAGVEQYLQDQNNDFSYSRFHYLVSDNSGEKVAGDLPPHTKYREFDDGWLGFELSVINWGESVDVDFIAREVVLGDGYSAIVARDYAEAARSGRLVFATLLRAMLATILMGLLGGYFAAVRTLRRIDWLNQEVARILGGDPTQRLEIGEEKGHLRELAQYMNQMLDQSQSLMQGVRSVSDNIAHDLRTPLTRMRNHLSQLRNSLPEESLAQVDNLITDCDALLASFNAVLRISALEAGSRYSGDSEVNLFQLLEDAVELYEPLAQDKDVAITLTGNRVLMCRGEADLLFQLFANVLDNAIKFSPEGQSIVVSLNRAKKSGEYHEITIADSGPGISIDQWDTVFRRFYRVDSSRSAQPGHGLGLSMARAIAGYHGGEIALGDNRPGLRLTVKLP